MREPIAVHRTRRPAGFRLAAAAAVALCAFASPAGAEIFHVEVVDGHVFDTRYQPEEASWDSNLVLLLTDTGNWIAVPKSEIAGITTETENKGFGRVIDTTTVLLGWAANDAPLPEDEARFAAVERLQQLFEQRQGQDYTVDQFVDPGEAGRGGGGLPAYGAGAQEDFTYFGDLGALTGGGVAGGGVSLGPAPPPAPSVGAPADVSQPISPE